MQSKLIKKIYDEKKNLKDQPEYMGLIKELLEIERIIEMGVIEDEC